MKQLAAAIALLCVPSTVLAHDIYSNLRDKAGHLCCNGQDCKPVEATVLPDGNYYLPTTDEVIPAELATPSPDDRFHHCTYYEIGNEFDPRWTGPIWGDEIAPEPTGHGLPLSKCEAYNRVYEQPCGSS
jgi:hypothetical protein